MVLAQCHNFAVEPFAYDDGSFNVKGIIFGRKPRTQPDKRAIVTVIVNVWGSQIHSNLCHVSPGLLEVYNIGRAFRPKR